jgi:heme-degrading monooxygenase HmoA
MIRHVIMIQLKPGTADEQIAALGAAMDSLRRCPGMLALTWGRDQGLRDGNMSFAAVFDFADEEAYRAFDSDAEHDRLRREVAAPVMERAERCQFRV